MWARAAIVALAASVVPVLGVAPSSGAAAAGPWAPGVTVVSDSPLPPRDSPAVVPMGTRVLVFGGGRVGEGVADPEGRRDGAILDLVTKRWHPIAGAPFPLVGASGVWTGSQVVFLGSEPTCSETDGTGCPTSSLRAAVYTPSTDRWRAIALPSRYREPNRWFPSALHWTGDEALFSLAPDGIGIRPSDGRVRAVALPSHPETAGECDTGTRFVSIALRGLDGRARLQPAVVDRTANHTGTGPSFDAAEPGSPWSVTCTRSTAIVTSGDGATVLRYDLPARRWSTVNEPPGPAPCTVGTTACEQYRFSGHGTVVDAWVPGRPRALRYDTKRGRWTGVAPGPPADTSVDVVWAGGLGVTTRFDPTTGAGTGELVVWRPA